MTFGVIPSLACAIRWLLRQTEIHPIGFDAIGVTFIKNEDGPVCMRWNLEIIILEVRWRNPSGQNKIELNEKVTQGFIAGYKYLFIKDVARNIVIFGYNIVFYYSEQNGYLGLFTVA